MEFIFNGEREECYKNYVQMGKLRNIGREKGGLRNRITIFILSRVQFLISELCLTS